MGGILLYLVIGSFACLFSERWGGGGGIMLLYSFASLFAFVVVPRSKHIKVSKECYLLDIFIYKWHFFDIYL